MLKYFRINDPYRLVGLLVIAILIFAPFLIGGFPITLPELKSLLVGEKITEGYMPYAGLVDSSPPLTSWLYGLVDLMFGSSLLARHILAFLLIFIQGVYIGFLFINRKVFPENTYLPSFIFIILHAFSFDTIVFSGELVGATFLLFALSSMFKEIESRVYRLDTLLNLGVYVGIASLFSFSYLYYLPAACLVIVLYSRRELGSLLLVITGFLLPHLLLAGVYYMLDEAPSLWTYYYAPNFKVASDPLMRGGSLLLLGAVPLFYSMISLVVLGRGARFTKYQSQLFQVMFLWTIFVVPQFFYAKSFRPQSLIVLIPAATFFLTNFLLQIRRRRYAEMNLWLLFLGLIAGGVLTRYGYIEEISYKELIVEKQHAPITGKKLLVLQDDLSYYLENKAATSFINWKLSEQIFKEAGYYENLIKVNEAFAEDPPDAIIDPNRYMESFMEKIPALHKQYDRGTQGIYHRRVNN